MPSTIVFHADEHYTETVYSADPGMDVLFETAAHTLAIGRGNGCSRYLGDCRALGFVGPALEVEHLVTFIKASGIGAHDREALIVPAGAERDGNFVHFEELCSKHGITVRLFLERDEALRWLLEQ
jgi:hypothetical protein